MLLNLLLNLLYLLLGERRRLRKRGGGRKLNISGLRVSQERRRFLRLLEKIWRFLFDVRKVHVAPGRGRVRRGGRRGILQKRGRGGRRWGGGRRFAFGGVGEGVVAVGVQRGGSSGRYRGGCRLPRKRFV